MGLGNMNTVFRFSIFEPEGPVILNRCGQQLSVPYPIDSTIPSMAILSSFSLLLKASSQMLLTCSGITTLVRLQH